MVDGYRQRVTRHSPQWSTTRRNAMLASYETKRAVRGVVILAVTILCIALFLVAGRGRAAPVQDERTAKSSSQPEPVASEVASPGSPNCGPDWIVVPSPNLGSSSNFLQQVAVVSGADIWAV